MQAVGIPFIDSSTPAAVRGFAPMNVPIGSNEYVEQHLKRKLFDPKLWRLSWQLQGSAQLDLQAAFLTLRGSLAKRLVYGLGTLTLCWQLPTCQASTPSVSGPWSGSYTFTVELQRTPYNPSCYKHAVHTAYRLTIWEHLWYCQRWALPRFSLCLPASADSGHGMEVSAYRHWGLPATQPSLHSYRRRSNPTCSLSALAEDCS